MEIRSRGPIFQTDFTLKRCLNTLCSVPTGGGLTGRHQHVTDVARVSTILTRDGYAIGQSTLGKTMATDDKKTSSTPKNGGVEKTAVAAKKDEGQPKDKTTPDADRSKAESGDKTAGSPAGYSRGEGQKPVSKAYRDNWNAIFGNKKKKR